MGGKVLAYSGGFLIIRCKFGIQGIVNKQPGIKKKWNRNRCDFRPRQKDLGAQKRMVEGFTEHGWFGMNCTRTWNRY